jgi:hypothetical protein
MGWVYGFHSLNPAVIRELPSSNQMRGTKREWAAPDADTMSWEWE